MQCTGLPTFQDTQVNPGNLLNVHIKHTPVRLLQSANREIALPPKMEQH